MPPMNGHKDELLVVDNFINNEFLAPTSGNYLDVTTPFTLATIAKVALSNATDVERAIDCAAAAFPAWSSLTVKTRASYMFKLHHLIIENSEKLAEIVSKENGKTIQESLASVAKANETVEFACSLPQVMSCKTLQVSSAVTCSEMKRPLGVIASIVPFNFPIMVPLWTIPIALTCGNTAILKCSEKCPCTMKFVAELFVKAGFPKGVFQIINGQKESVDCLLSSPKISAITFVGSSPVAKHISETCGKVNKRCIALGGAKNHLVALQDADLEMTATDVVGSFAGCAGQRCMAASVLIIVNPTSALTPFSQALLSKIASKSKALTFGNGKGCLGPVIDNMSRNRILALLKQVDKGVGEKECEYLVDGRDVGEKKSEETGGSWLGATVVLHKLNGRGTTTDSLLSSVSIDPLLTTEVFGPVLSIVIVSSPEDALAIENANPFGNAACVYTNQGHSAEAFAARFRAGMIGVNVGIPVPREPFSFGGLYGTRSKYAHGDITGEGAVNFFTDLIKVTTKWSGGGFNEADKAQFK